MPAPSAMARFNAFVSQPIRHAMSIVFIICFVSLPMSGAGEGAQKKSYPHRLR